MTPFLADLYEITHETVHLATLHGAEDIYLAKLFGHRRVPSPSRVGDVSRHTRPLSEKALIAHDPAAFDHVMMRGPLSQLTAHTITDSEELALQLMRIRRDGVSSEREEAALVLACVAIPVYGIDSRPVAGLSVSAPAATFDPRTYMDALRRVSLAATQSHAARRCRNPPPGQPAHCVVTEREALSCPGRARGPCRHR